MTHAGIKDNLVRRIQANDRHGVMCLLRATQKDNELPEFVVEVLFMWSVGCNADHTVLLACIDEGLIPRGWTDQFGNSLVLQALQFDRPSQLVRDLLDRGVEVGTTRAWPFERGLPSIHARRHGLDKDVVDRLEEIEWRKGIRDKSISPEEEWKSWLRRSKE